MNEQLTLADSFVNSLQFLQLFQLEKFTTMWIDENKTNVLKQRILCALIHYKLNKYEEEYIP